MSLNRLIDPLWLNADVALCYCGGAVLQKPLNICLVNLCRIPFAEAVGADPLEAKVIAYNSELLLNRPFRNRKHAVIALDAIAQTVVLNVLLDDQRDGEDAALPCLLFNDLQAVAVSVHHDVRGTEAENVADP